MICRKCGVKNKDTRTRCFYCGAALEKKPIASTQKPEIIVEPTKKENAIPEIVIEPLKEAAIVDIPKQESTNEAIVEEKVIPEIVIEPIAEENIAVAAPNNGLEENATVDEQASEEQNTDSAIVEDEECETVIEEVPTIEEVTAVIDEINAVEKTEEVEQTNLTEAAEDNTDAVEDEALETDAENTVEAETAVEAIVTVVEPEQEENKTEETENNEDTVTDNEEVVAEESEINETSDDAVADTDDEQIPALEIENTLDEDVEFTKKNNKKKFLWLLIVPIIIVALIVLFVINPFKKNQPQVPTISVVADNNGDEYVHAIFYGKPGDVLKLKCNDSSYTFNSEQLVIDLYLKDLFPQGHNFDNGTVDVNLQAYYINGTENYCETPVIGMKVPMPETDLSTSTKEINEFGEFYNLCFAVEDGAKVTLNGEELTANGLGIINHQITIPTEGATFELKIEKDYHQPFIKEFIFKNEDLPIDLTLSSDVSAIHSGSEITINYVASEGAQILSNLPVKSLVPGQTPGSFDVTLDISSCEYGTVEAVITAKQGDSTLKKSISFKYWPSEDELLSTATLFNETVLAEPEYNKIYTFEAVNFLKAYGINKVIGNVNGTELNFDISGLSGDIQPDTMYDAVGTLIEENGKPVIKLWYAAPPQEALPEDVFEDINDVEVAEH